MDDPFETWSIHLYKCDGRPEVVEVVFHLPQPQSIVEETGSVPLGRGAEPVGIFVHLGPEPSLVEDRRGESSFYGINRETFEQRALAEVRLHRAFLFEE